MTPSGAFDPRQTAVLSPATFLTLEPGAAPGPMFAALQSLNLVTIWILVLLVIGYRNLAPGRVSTPALTVSVLAPWLVWVAARVAMAAAF